MQNYVLIDQCVSAIGAAQVPIFLQTLTCSNDASVARILVGSCQATAEILSDLCCLPCAAAVIGPANPKTLPLMYGGCYHMTDIGGPYGL
jgi:hypothetical protein